METLFKFTLSRPAVEQAPNSPSIPLAQRTTFQDAIAAVLGNDVARDKRRAVASAYVASNDFVPDPRALEHATQWEAFGSALDTLEQSENVTHAGVVEVAESALQEKLAKVIERKELANNSRRLRDSILAIKLLPQEHRRPLHRLVGALRDIELLLELAANPAFPDDAAHLRRFRRRSIRLSVGEGTDVVAPSILGTPRKQLQGDGSSRQAELAKELARLRGLSAAVEELTRVPASALVATPLQASPESLAPTTIHPIALFESRLARAGTAIVTAGPGGGQRGTFSGRSALRAEDLAQLGFRLADKATASLSKETVDVLTTRGMLAAKQPLDQMVESLRAESRSVARTVERLADRAVQRSFKRFGGVVVAIKTTVASPWTDILMGEGVDALPPMPAPDEAQIPDSHGSVAPSGVADLIIVKQQLLRYEAAEVAHIENVLQGERKQRDHRRRQETERFTLRETEVTTSEERELETTDRFEMVRETNDTLRESAALKAGLTISGSYGPSVEFSASAEGSVSRDREQATKTAATFSKETTQKSASKITERVLQRETLRVTTSVEETNSHVLDNVGGTGHIRGVYQWIEKVYQARMFNYGLRLLYDFVLPEPAAFLIESLKRGHASAVELEKPMRFSLRPDQITEYNYQTWLNEYGATDIVPPPEPYLTKTLDYAAGGGDEGTDYNHSAQITIDDGYRAIYASVGVTGNVWDSSASVDVVIGQRANRIMNAGYKVWHTDLDNERGAVPFALNTFRQSDLAIAVEVKAQRTETAMNRWRHETHAKLTLAYRARLAEYEEKLAALKAEAGIAIEGKNPAANLELMNTEIKKGCLSLLTGQHFDLFGAIETGTNGLPQIDLDENAAEGPYVRFFEQAFEWEQMTWITYPYFWGRKSAWTDRIAYEDSDPLFGQFLKAGYCRAVVPVRPGFEGAVDHFMTLGEPWMGGPLPPVSSPLFLPIADELAERLDRPGEEIPFGEPWEVRVPTNLVRLRDDGTLPSWTQDANGNWLPQ